MTEPVRIDISGKTLIRVLAVLVAVWLWLQVWELVLLLVVASFLAVGLDPVVTWLDAHHVRRRFAAPILVLVIVLAGAVFVFLAGSALNEQAALLGGQFDDVRKAAMERVPPRLREVLPSGVEGGQKLGTYLLSLGQSLVNGILGVGVALVLTVYLLLDGRRTYEWLVAFAPAAHRPRVRQTAMEARTAVLAYVRGNMLTSALAGTCAYIAMLLLHVPAALLLAIITAVFDLLPVIGIFMSTIPAVLLGLTVSTWVGVGVALYHAAYNIVENYYITPKVYGRELRLSDLAVILALAIGGALAGVIGALVFLPIVALYPAVERIWLRDAIPPETVQDHRRIENTKEH